MITKREIIFSIAIICVLLVIGFVISQGISDNIAKKNQEYDCALQIESEEQFRYGMKTNVGNAFVYGDYISLDPVTTSAFNGSYSYLAKYTEEYTKHERTVKYKDSDGKEKTRTEEYWTWDRIKSEYWSSSYCTFLNVGFSASLFILPQESYITTLPAGYHLRHKWYGKPANYKGTIYTKLANNTITKSDLIDNKNTLQTLNYLKAINSSGLTWFWVGWIILIVVATIGFYYVENKWLE